MYDFSLILGWIVLNNFQHKSPDYSCPYVIVKTDTDLEGRGMTFTVGRGNHIGILWPLNIKNIGLLFPDDPPKLSLPIISYQGFEDFFFYLSYRVRYSQEQLREIIH